jgi:CRP-like cAMP-binding protein
MHEIFLEWLRKRMTLPREYDDLVRASLRPRGVKKGEVLQRAGEVATYGYFVTRGFLRGYSIDEKGKDHTTRFAPEGWWITDFPSIRDRVPANFFVEALEDTDVLLLDWPSHHGLMEKVPGFAGTFAAGLLRMDEAREKRLLDSMSATAEERYVRFIETYPSIARRVPLHMLASYLGITPETLSRLRARLSKAKPARRP